VFVIARDLAGLQKKAIARPVGIVYLAFCGFFSAELIAALVHPSWIALNEVLENLPFLGFAAIYSITFVDRAALLASVEIGSAICAVVGAIVLGFTFDVNYRPELLAGNPAVLSLLSCVLFVVTVGAASRREGWLMLIYLTASLCAMFMVIVTGTRSIWPALIMVPILALIAFRPLRQAFMGSCIVMLAVGLIVGLGMSFSKTLETRISYTISDVRSVLSGDMTGNVAERLHIYKAGYQLVLENAFLGYGPGNDREAIAKKTFENTGGEIAYSHAHNVLLNATLRAGLVGLVALLALIIVPVVAVHRAERDDIGQVGLFTLYGILLVYLSAGAAGLMLGHDIHDAVFIAAQCFALYLVFGRKEMTPQSRIR
jgi:O-antigen ligase